jgi:hypothetical protein
MDVLVVLDPDPELDPEIADRTARQLRSELSELDIESIRNTPGKPAPSGTKGADVATVSDIIMTMSASGGALTMTIAAIKEWLARQSQRHHISVTIDGDTIDLADGSADERRQLVQAYVRRHSTG